jgi:hypothetical protein
MLIWACLTLDLGGNRSSDDAQIFSAVPQVPELRGGLNIGGSLLRHESRIACKVVNGGVVADGFISAIFRQQSGGIVH